MADHPLVEVTSTSNGELTERIYDSLDVGTAIAVPIIGYGYILYTEGRMGFDAARATWRMIKATAGSVIASGVMAVTGSFLLGLPTAYFAHRLMSARAQSQPAQTQARDLLRDVEKSLGMHWSQTT